VAVGIVEELENESVRPTEVTVENIRHDTGLQASAHPSGESLKRLSLKRIAVCS
jgi:hypothetical protein